MSLLAGLGHIAGGVILSPAAELGGGIKEAVRQGINKQNAIALPPISAVLAAGIRGVLSPETMTYLAGLHGANFNTATPPEQAFRRAHVDGWLAALEMHRTVPAVSQVTEAFLRDHLNEDQWRRGMVRAGADPALWSWLLESFAKHIEGGDLTEAINRGLIPPDQVGHFLARAGWAYPEAAGVFLALRESLPGAGELVQWASRQAMLPATADALGLYDEAPEEVWPWVEKTGLFGGPGFNITSDGKQRPARWLDIMWAAHWQQLSPGQVFDIYYRLRPDRVKRYQDQGLNVQPFTLDQVRQWLGIDRYPPAVRDYLVAISHRPLGRRDLQQALTQGTRDRQWAVDVLLDQGYLPDDASTVVDTMLARAEEQRLAPVRAAERRAVSSAISGIVSAYGVGLMPRDLAERRLTDMEMAADAASALLDAEDLRQQITLAKEVIASVRRDYFAGALSADGARQELSRIGLTDQARDRYVTRWEQRLDHPRRVTETAAILRYVREGLLSAEQAKNRMRILGWSDDAILLALAEVDGRVRQDEARQLAANDRSQRQQAHQAEMAARQSQATKEHAQATLRRLQPVGKLIRWMEDGVVSEDYVRKRMDAQGYPQEVIDEYIADARHGQATAAARAAPKGPAPRPAKPQPAPKRPPGG